MGRIKHLARILRPSYPVGLGNLPNPIGLKSDPTVTLNVIVKKQTTKDRILANNTSLTMLKNCQLKKKQVAKYKIDLLSIRKKRILNK
jgi:hypothetical protein